MTAPALAAFEPNARGMDHCPAHEDNQRSLSVKEGKDGRLLLKCFAGCSFADILAARGLPLSDAFGPDLQALPPASGEPIATYRYDDADGRLAYIVKRWPDKRFSMHRPDGSSIGTTPRVPYRLPEILASDRGIVVVEGEKDADRLAALGIVATTNAGGAGQWVAEWAPYFAGKRVAIIPDHDEPGRKHAADVAASLRDVAREVRIVTLPDLPDRKGADVSDWLDMGHDVDELRAILAEAPILPGPPTVVSRLGARVLADVPDLPPPPLLVDRLDPEGHSILFGDGGVGKGTMASWWIVQLVRAGHRVLILDYENHPGEWRRRIGGLGGGEAVAGVVIVAPLTVEYGGVRGSIGEQAIDLRALADEVDATYVVIDSVIPACGADPMAPETVSAYTAALLTIGRPVLSLAHVTKAGGDARYPFGSVFWHNLARFTWSMALDGDGAILRCKKANNYGPQPRVSVSITWRDGRPVDVLERSYAAVLSERIADVLADGPATVAAIVAKLRTDRDEDDAAIKPDSVRHTLRRGVKSAPKRFTVAGDGDDATWSVVP